jgi:hypothetical protein
MDSSVSPKDEICFLRVRQHISNAVYPECFFSLSTVQKHSASSQEFSTNRFSKRLLACLKLPVSTTRKEIWKPLMEIVFYTSTHLYDMPVLMSVTVQQDATFYSFIPCKLLYMFRVISSPIIRSVSKL